MGHYGSEVDVYPEDAGLGQQRYSREELMAREEKLAKVQRSIEYAASEQDGIQSQLESLNEQVQKTQAMLSELISRIDPVLIPESEDVNVLARSDVDAPMPNKSRVSLQVENLNSNVRRLQHRISETIQRVSL